MAKEKATHQDATDFDGPIKTGDAHAKRPADKDVGDKTADTSAAEPVKTFKSGKVAEEVEALFASVEGLSEDFINKATVIFEGAVSEQESVIREELETQYGEKLQEAVEVISSNLEESLNDYLNLFIETFIKENRPALEEGFKVELAEAVMKSVTTIVESAGVDLSDVNVDLTKTLAEENEKLEAKLNETLNETVELKKQIRSFELTEAFNRNTQGLSDSARDKLTRLTENLSFNSVEEYEGKLNILKESISTSPKGAEVQNLTEVSDPVKVEDKALNDRMAAYVKTLRGE